MSTATHPGVREELAAQLGHLIQGLREFSDLHDEAWALDDVRAWIEEARGVSFREYVFSLSAQLPPGFPPVNTDTN